MYEEFVTDLGQVGKTCDFAAIFTQLATIPHNSSLQAYPVIAARCVFRAQTQTSLSRPAALEIFADGLSRMVFAGLLIVQGK